MLVKKEKLKRFLETKNLFKKNLFKEKFAALHSGFTRLAVHHDTSTTSKFVPDLFAPRSAADKTHFVNFDKMVGNIFGL